MHLGRVDYLVFDHFTWGFPPKAADSHVRLRRGYSNKNTPIARFKGLKLPTGLSRRWEGR